MSTQTCPSRDDLKAFALGTLTADRIAAIGEHLEACSGCVAELTTLDAVGDTLVASLGNLGESDTYERESSLRHALERIEEFGRDPSFTSRALGQPDAWDPDDTVDLEPNHARRGSPDPAETADRRSPDPADLGTLHDYRLLTKLGEGGMGTVYKALHVHLEKIVALKVLPKERMTDRNAVARFEREIKAVGRLNHPHIVQALDARQIEGSYILALEYVEGMDLNDVAAHVGSLRIADACEVVRQAALGLQAAFEHGLIHRDIKPSNLMLSVAQSSRHTPCAVTSPADGTRSVPATKAIVKILDFGLARLGGDGGAAAHGEMTSAGTAMGTADYMAPEQATDSHSVDIRADIYSLGCTLYKLLAGRAPFSGPKYKGHLEKITGHLRDTPPPIGLVRSDVAPDLASIIERMMAKDRESRFATPQEVFDALAPFATGADLGRLAREATDMAAGVQPLDQSSVGTDRHISSAHTGTTPSLLECGAAPPLAPVLRDERPGVRGTSPSDIQTAPVPMSATAGRGSNRRRILIALLAAAAAIPLLFAGWLIVRVRDEQGNVVSELKVPANQTVEIEQDGKLLPQSPSAEKPATKATVAGSGSATRNSDPHSGGKTASTADSEGESIVDPERRVAEWLLSIRGPVHHIGIMVDGEEREVGAEGLPSTPFHVTFAYLVECSGVTDKTIGRFRELKELRFLCVPGTRITDAAMADIGMMPALQELYLGGQPISDRGLQQLGNLRQLNSLGLPGTKVTVKGLLDFPLLPNLEELHLNGLPITDDDLKQLQPRLPRLRRFSLSGTMVTDEGLRHLPPNVSELFVPGTAVNGSGFANLKGRSFWRIVLDGTPLNDAGVGSVRSLASVANLDLTDTRVTDAGVEDLISVPGLQAVVVTKNRFSAKGLAAIKAAYPKVDLSSSWEPNRAAAERVVSVNGRVVVSVKRNDAELVVATAQDLPQDYFRVRRVDLAGVTKPLDSVLSTLAELKDPEFDGLESIDFSRSTLCDPGLGVLASVPSLTDLSLAETQVTSAGLTHLKEMIRLRRLILDGT